MRFSIIIPVYNIEKYIGYCLETVLSQNFKNYEIVLVDDGSLDGSLKICRMYEKEYPDMFNIICKTNGGLSDARNYGVQYAKGEYIIFLDGDDFWSSNNMLSAIDQVISDSKPDLIIFGSEKYWGNEGERDFHAKSVNNNKSWIKNNISNGANGYFYKDFNMLVDNGIYRLAAWDKVIKKDVLVNNNIDFPLGRLSEDIDWCNDLSKKINTYRLIDEKYYVYRQGRSGSITFSISRKNILDIIDMVEKNVCEIKGGEDTYSVGLMKFNCYIYLSVIPYLSTLEEKDRVELFSRIKKLNFLLQYARGSKLLKYRVYLFILKVLGVVGGSKVIFLLNRTYKIIFQ